MNHADINHDANDVSTFAGRSSADRRRAAKKQARDRFGRWISIGANVKWSENGNNYSGLIKGTNENSATITLTSGDKKGTQVSVPAKSLSVITSKATLTPANNPYYDENNDVKASLDNSEFIDDIDKSGSSGIQREDGYILRGRKNDDEESSGSNPYLYQLYAPGGRSLGEYTKDAKESFDDMISTDKAEHEESESNVSPTEDQVALSGPVVASVVRVSRDGTNVIISEKNLFFSVDLATNKTITESKTLDVLIASGSWRKPISDEKNVEYFLSSDIDIKNVSPMYRVPKAVKEAVVAALTSDIAFDPIAATHMNSLANDDAVSLNTVNWIQNFFSYYSLEEQSRGGHAGNKWASKIIGDQTVGIDFIEEDLYIPEQISYEDAFDDDEFMYIGVGNITGSNVINRLYCVDEDSGAMYQWLHGMFVLIDEISLDEFSAESIIVLDEHSASTIAMWIDTAAGTPEIDVLDTHPEERNLFTLAASELDFEELDRSFGIIADATGYTPAERSVNAKRQKRGPGGRFGGEQVEQGKTLDDSFKKGTIPTKMLPVANIGEYIGKWLVQASETAEGVTPSEGGAPAAIAAAGEPTGDVLYFAIVDETDQTAVLDAIALSKTDNHAVAWKRSEGAWQASPETVKDLNGATPPVVVHLDEADTVKNVLSQVDAYDAETEIDTEDMQISASGFSLTDGSFDIRDSNDLEAAVLASGSIIDVDFDFQVKNHIRKRATALNRIDLVPAEWRSPTLAEIGYAETSSPVLFGDFGEVLTAGGIPGIADTPGDYKAAMRLQNYWTRGKGAAKIRWGTGGDLTRAHRHLTKYVGPKRAWGLAQKYHKSLFGVSNTTHDIATGQYRGRR